MEEAASRNTTPTDPVIANIKQEWHWVRAGLEQIYSNSPDIDEIPEDVYAACVSGNAHLWCHPAGFVVTRFVGSDHDRGLLLWHAWAREQGGKHSLEYHDFFEAVALNSGCTYLETQTVHQPIVDHFINRLGYRVKVHILTKQIGQ